jgi:hypothetical protein
MSSGAPGGEYATSGVPHYVSSGHWPAAFAVAYLGAMAALGLGVFGHGLRTSDGLVGHALGDLCWALAIAGTTLSVGGFFVAAGVDVAMAEGGHTVQAGVPHPIVYTLTEIGNLLLVCAPAFFAGVIAMVLAARSTLPTWLRVFSGVAGVCGILAPFYVTYFVFVLWVLVAGVALLVSSRRVPARGTLAESLV